MMIMMTAVKVYLAVLTHVVKQIVMLTAVQVIMLAVIVIHLRMQELIVTVLMKIYRFLLSLTYVLTFNPQRWKGSNFGAFFIMIEEKV